MFTSFNVVVAVICCLSSFVIVSVNGQYASTYPAPIPLINKSPYLNIWIASDDNLTTPGGRWPFFYSGPNVSLTGNIRVDGVGYIFQGMNPNYTTAKTVGAYITPTRTIFTIDAGPMRLNLTYLNPIEMADWKLHSFPFGYLAINLWSTDGQPHAVQLYSDVSGQFVSSNSSKLISWKTTQTSSMVYHRVQRSAPEYLVENKDMSEDGVLYFATQAGLNLTWQTSAFYTSRYGFLVNGTLTNTLDNKYRAIDDNFPVMSFSCNLGNVTSTTEPVVFALGLVRDPVLTYTREGNQNQNRSSLWWLKWNSVESGLVNFLGNYSEALSRAVSLDNKIFSDASNLALSANVSALYKDLLALNLRQALGAIELTRSKLPNGTWAGKDDQRAFIKDVGNSQRVNPVEVLYAAFPAFLYIDSNLAAALLQPLLEFQSSALYPRDYAAFDLGNSWPQVQGNTTDQAAYSVDNDASMLVMALAQAQKSGNGSLIHQYYGLFKQWADNLVTNALQPTGFLASDQISETSNLALKGIMGIYAMGKINKALEIRGADPAKTTYYLDTASSYAKQWESLALGSDHVTSAYGNAATWGLLYNLYLPRLLGANIFSAKIYETQAAWYASKVSSVDTFGFAYDTAEPLVAKAHWTMFTAGSVYNATITAARDALITMVQARPYFKNIINKPNPAIYRMDSGATITGISSPALGASFALLALSLSDQATISVPDSTIINSESSESGATVRSIAGGTVGGVLGLALICVAIVFFLRRRRAKKQAVDLIADNASEPLPQAATNITPFAFGSKRAQMMEELGAIPTSPSSTSPTSSKAGGTTTTSGESPGPLPKLVPQRPTHLHVTNMSPSTEEKSTSFRPSSSRSASERRQTHMQDDDGLRREVEQLRMEMDVLRGQQQLQQAEALHPDEPPPGYFSSGRQSQQ